MKTSNPEQWRSSDELDLVSAARGGDRLAFEELVRRYHNSCMQTALALTRNWAEAEDEVQNAYCQAYRHLEQLKGEMLFGPWLKRILRNQCLMSFRRSRRAVFLYLDEPLASLEGSLQIAVSDPNQEAQLEEKQVVQLVLREIDRTPPLFRQVVQLTDVQRMPIDRVAQRLGITVSAAKSRLVRARAAVRARVHGKCASAPSARVLVGSN